MATCKECLHNEICEDFKRNICEQCNNRHNEYVKTDEGICSRFQDKGNIINAPCKIGDLFYCVISSKGIVDDKTHYSVEPCRVDEIMYFGERGFLISVKEINRGYGHTATINKNAFKTFEEAEKELYRLRKKAQSEGGGK